jgi:RNA polymerase sigma-70 factor (ECF subfamily)
VATQSVEAVLGALLERGDLHGAATQALRSYGPQILVYLRAVLRDEEAASEAFSRWGEGLWKGIAAFRGDASILTWCYAVAWGAVGRVRRDAVRRRERRLATSEAARLVAEMRDSTAPELRPEARGALSRLRAALEADEQTLLILRLDRKLAWKDVAHVLGVDEAAARKRYERLKAKLRRLGRAEGLLAER